MRKNKVTVSFSEALFDVATATTQKQNKTLEEMLRIAAYEYVEKYAPERLSGAAVLGNETPVITRMANAILSNAIDRGASEIHLIPQTGNVSVILQVDGQLSEMMAVPNHLQMALYGRYAQMSSDPYGVRKSCISLRHNGKNYQVFLKWNDDYSSEMLLRIVPTSIG